MTSMTRYQRVGLGLVIGLLVLTALGGIVRVTGSGLACPDWPACYGSVFPTGDFGEFAAYQVWLEWTHRLVAAIMGLIILGYAIATWRRLPDRPQVWWPAVAAIPLLAVQVVLGGLTVTERLEDVIVTLHLATAMLILAAVAVSWLGTFDWRVVTSEDEAPLGSNAPSQARTFARVVLVTVILVYAVVVVGSYVTHVGAGPDSGAHVGPGGAACGNQWPLCYGGLWPDGEYAQWNMSHRLLVLVGGLAIFGAAMGVVMLRPRSRPLTLLLHGAATLYLAQVFIGAAMIWINFDNWARALHLSMGSIVWLLTAAAALVAAYRAGWLGADRRASATVQPMSAVASGNAAESEGEG
ncbi:MAG: heme A synthase [Chloroflexi bacterium]|nr:heme A synthase [Chloroflexota bacterium]MYF21920.1 heme A synthase [Chloroflexota bacterium]